MSRALPSTALTLVICLHSAALVAGQDPDDCTSSMALRFDGIDDEVFVPADASLHPDGQLTVEASVFCESYDAVAADVAMIVNSSKAAGQPSSKAFSR